MKLREILDKYAGEVITRPPKPGVFEYRGYTARFDLDDDDRYMITYSPSLPKKLERMFSTCKSRRQGEKMAINAIDLAHEMELQASGQAAQAGELRTGSSHGPLERNNG